MSQTDRTPQRLIKIYRKKAKHYDLTSRLYPAPGYPQRAQRQRTVHALDLHPGDRVIDLACGTGLNFPLIQQAIGPHGHITGVDLTDAMLTQAQHRIDTHHWTNIDLIQADAATYPFPTNIDAILSTYALTQIPDCATVIAHAAAALRPGGRCAILDLKIPDNTPHWLTHLGTTTIRPFAAIDEWTLRQPWTTIHTAIQQHLTNPTWTELLLGTAFLTTGTRHPETADTPSHLNRPSMDV